ncbi:hypothetical protein [Magnetospirillum sp. 15-1]|uniref:hypothetical protein n=1 Tax=Magnetospirillum sp. 15-1 TaxID=1979370 RepID=UPI000BBC67C6|nr:hypothetical protein [Magnetospirillum sp. 15-1]
MVPETVDGLGGRRFEAKRGVWAELRRQLSDDHVVFACSTQADEPTPDFVVLGPRGLVYIAVTPGILDVLAPPAPGVIWTHRGGDGYFIGAFGADGLQRAADILERRLLSTLPSCHHRRPGEFGRGLLHVLPDTMPAYTPGIDLASPDRRVLINSDLGRLGEWVDRAGGDLPANPAMPAELRRDLGTALSRMAEPTGLLPHGISRRRSALAAAGLAAALIVALVSERVGSGPTLPNGKENEIQDGRAVFTLPTFVPAQAEWAVRNAVEVAWDDPDRPIRWRHGELTGTVQQLPRDGRPCRAFRIGLDLGGAAQFEDRRFCR